MGKVAIAYAVMLLYLAVSLTAADFEEQLERISAVWEDQHVAAVTAQVSFFEITTEGLPGMHPVSAGPLRETILRFALSSNPELAREELLGELYGLTYSKLEVASGRWILEGESIRSEVSGFTQVLDDGSHLRLDARNQFVEIRDRGLSPYSVADWNTFRFLPSPLLMDRLSEVAKSSALFPRALSLKRIKGNSRYNYHVDEETGDVRFYERSLGELVAEQIFQWDFRNVPGGGRLPFMRLRVTYDNPTPIITTCIVEGAEINGAIADDEFVLAVPAQTLVYDYRGLPDGAPGRSFRVDEDKEDLLAHIDETRQKVEESLLASPMGVRAGQKVSLLTVVLVNVAVMAVIGCALLYFRRRRRKEVQGIPERK